MSMLEDPTCLTDIKNEVLWSLRGGSKAHMLMCIRADAQRQPRTHTRRYTPDAVGRLRAASEGQLRSPRMWLILEVLSCLVVATARRDNRLVEARTA